jgi:hypothetical protein
MVMVGTVNANSTVFIDSNFLNADLPAQSAGTYTVYVVNPDGGTAIRVNGITYSSTPTWITGSQLSEQTVDIPISIQLSTTSDSLVSYSLATGSTLPSGVSLSSSGLLSGTVTGLENETVYSFTVEAIDAENQESPRTFTVTVTVGEPFFNQTVLLLNGDGGSAAKNNTFLDSSANNFTTTRGGNATQGTFSPFSLAAGQWSNYFDGNNDYLSLSANTAFDLTQGDFLVEAFVYLTAAGATRNIFGYRLDSPARGWEFRINSDQTLQLFYTGGSTVTSTGTVALNQWVHVAASRSGSTCRLFINGTQDGSQTFSNGTAVTTTLYIGISYDLSTDFIGYISNARIVKGVGVTSVSVPDLPLTSIENTSLLTCQSNRFVDNSTNGFAVTANGNVRTTPFSPFPPISAYIASVNSGSGYFDGSGDEIVVSQSLTNFFTATGDWTAEAWVYPLSFNGPQYSCPIFGSSSDAFVVRANPTSAASTSLNLYLQAAAGGIIGGASSGTSGGTLTINQWSHVAAVRYNGVFDVYLNGAKAITINEPSSQLKLTDTSIRIGGAAAGTNPWWNGYISEVRIVNGTAAYTSAFTPPTGSLSAISGTSLLVKFTNAAIIDLTSRSNIETVGDAQISTAEKKYGTGSILLTPGGGGHYTRAPLTENLQFGTGDFTVECWIYLITNVAGICAVWSNYSSFGAGSLSLFAGHNSSNNNLFIIAHNGGFPALSSTTTVNSRLGLWTHLAVVRSSGQIKLYVNGVSEGTPFASTVALDGVGSYFWVGTTGDSPAANPNCYIDDFRVTKGVARYTSNFTPPTSAHKIR